jgi:hypothetical protein
MITKMILLDINQILTDDQKVHIGQLENIEPVAV